MNNSSNVFFFSKAPKGVLLYGPPGTGKTLLAKALASNINATFLKVVASAIVDKYIGESARIIREMFGFARDHQPCVIFMDEIDAIGGSRFSEGTSADREIQRTLMELLNQMDGFEDQGQVKMVMATNRPDILDPALLRPGRLDRKIEIPEPNETQRLEILKIHSAGITKRGDIDFESVVKLADGLNGADMRNICTEAGLFAIRSDRDYVLEEDFMKAQMTRLGKDVKMSYTKITNLNAGKKLTENLSNLLNNKLNIIVYNFVDMLSHARTDMEVIRELADNEPAYRSITKSWFEHSPLHDILKQLAEKKIKVVITTDHGTVHVKEPTKVLGDKNVNSNLRYKQGKALDYNPKEVFEIKNPSDAFLPKVNVSQRFIFAKESRFFAYPNNYNYYVNYYRNTFQHGGISLEEMIIPFVVLQSK